MNLVRWIMGIALFTASCDYILAIQVAGTLRLANIMVLLLMLGALGRMIQFRTILWPRGGTMLALWCVIQGLLIARSAIPTFSINIYLLMIFTIAGVYAVLQLYGQTDHVESLMRLYLASFVFVAAFGLFQFITPALHLGTWLVVQWIAHGLIPRINGFSYEPSYFVTYLIMGWITLIDLRVTGARIVAGTRWKLFTILVTAVFFLSTSKTAYIFLIVEALARLVPIALRGLKRQALQLRQGRLILPLPSLRVLFGIVLAIAASAALFQGVSRIVDPTIFVAGSGLGDTSSQSLTDRLSGAQETLQVFSEHPWLGLSFGGVVGRIAEIRGYPILTMADYRYTQAFPVPLDVLAASGILGVIPFLWFFVAITFGEIPLMRRHPTDERSKWLHALIRAMVYEWLILLVDQNLVRIYLWFHVTMLVVVGYNLRFRPTPQPQPSLAPATP